MFQNTEEDTDACDSDDVPFKNVGTRSKRELVANTPEIPTFPSHAYKSGNNIRRTFLLIRERDF